MMETSTIYIIGNLDGLFNFYHNAIQRSRMSDRSSSCSATQRWRLFSAIPRAPPLSMVNYKGHLFAFRVPFIQAVTSLQAQINEDQHPLAIRCRRLTFSSTKVAYSPRSSQPPPSPSSASLHPSNFVLESSCDAPPIRGGRLTTVPLIFSRIGFSRNHSRGWMEVLLARITRLDLLSFVNQWLRQFPPPF